MDFIEIKQTDDIKASLKIRNEVFIKEQRVPKDLELDEYDKDAMHFIAYCKDQAVGCARARLKDDYLKIERVAVLKNFRGKGIAIRLMRFVEEYLQSLYPKKALKLNAQSDVEEFYKKLGYQSIGEYFYEAGIKHIEMKRTPNYGGPF